MQHETVLCTRQYNTVLYSTTLLYYTSQYSTTVRYSTLHCTAHGLSCGCLLPLFICAGEKSVLSHVGNVRVQLENI